MKTTTKEAPKTEAKTRKPRKATFITVEIKGEVRYQPVNKRAKAEAKVLKAKALTKAQLKTVAKKFRVYQYAANGALRPLVRS